VSTTSESKSEDFLGETLFHFLGDGDDERLLDVFDSIVRRGLLLTVGNKEGKLDRFPVQMVGGGYEFLEVMQHARVCFTDIPEKLLSTHCQEYGKFGLGFSRKTILEWGGNPVIYVPNHPAPGTLETSMPDLLYCLHRVSPLMDKLRDCLAILNAAMPISERAMDGENGAFYIDYINGAEQSVRRMWAFVKEMSSQKANDYQYLYEREWRIVDGALIQGVDPTRELSDDEYRELGSKCARWTRPLDMSESLSRKHVHTRMLQLFRFFNGLSDKSVSQAIEVILVPSDATKGRVTAYIADHRDNFRPGGPAIRVFGETRRKKRVLRRSPARRGEPR
jgi:hypothetical protein